MQLRFATAAGAAALISISSGALGVPLGTVSPSAIGMTPVMLVCTADGCRHRYKSYRARPAWNAYLMREYPPKSETAEAADRRGDGHRR